MKTLKNQNMRKLLNNLPWEICTRIELLDHDIINCAPLSETILLDGDFQEADVVSLRNEIEKDSTLFLYLHKSGEGTKDHPIFCILKELPSESADKIRIQIGKKLKRINFRDSNAIRSFVDIIYSDRNKMKLAKYDLQLPARNLYHM